MSPKLRIREPLTRAEAPDPVAIVVPAAGVEEDAEVAGCHRPHLHASQHMKESDPWSLASANFEVIDYGDEGEEEYENEDEGEYAEETKEYGDEEEPNKR